MALQWVKPWIALVFGLSAAHSETVMIPDMTSIGSLYDSKLQIVSAGASPTHNGQVCSTWGNYHYKTYDGDLFQLPYTCNYVLSSLCKSSSGYEAFNIQLQRGEVDGLPTITKVSLKLDGTFVELANGNVSVNRLQVTIPFGQFNVFIERTVSYVKITAKLGLVIMWNEDDSLWVELDSKFQNHTCGLCGDFNGVQNEFNRKDDYLKIIDYADIWKMNGPTETCTEIPVHTEQCEDQTKLCEQLLTSLAFSSCKDLIATDSFIKACAEDMCHCGNSSSSVTCACPTMSEYSRQCAHAGGKPQEWKTDQFCLETCPLSMQYQECGSPCTDTCSNPKRNQHCEEHCTDGCFCPAGTVFDDITQTGCVAVNQCSCLHNGQSYQPGQSFSRTCHKCTCIQGQWSCMDLDCPATCSIVGGSHITTYDGKAYTFHGDCSYVLSKQTNKTAFTVLGDIVKCGKTDIETCLRSVTLVTPESTMIVIEAMGRVFVNKMFSQMPLFMADVKVFQPSTFYIVVHTSYGLRLEVQLTPIMQVYIVASSSHKEKTQGLCGDFNGVQADDFRTINGLVEGTAVTFANTWKTKASCPDVAQNFEMPCSLSVENERYAKHWCSMLSDSEGIFSQCHTEINPNYYKEICLYDSCNCERSEECMCAAVSSYVHACAAAGVLLSGWRNTTCGKYSSSCPDTMVYDYTMTSCDRTCRSLSQTDFTCQLDHVSVDGCGCAEGTYLNDQGECVPASRCSCYNGGTVVPPGEVTRIYGATCSCRQGKLSCPGEQQHLSCEEPMGFFNCSSAGPGAKGSECQKSCQTLDSHCISAECVSGCVCPDGLLSDGNGGCIKDDLCPCSHNGVYYQPGHVLKVDCNTCTCEGRKWQCTNKQCDGMCAIYGDGHFITFDEKRFTFNGDCEYILTQDYCSNNPKGTFRVITENIPCGTTGTTCSKAIKIFLGNNEIRLADESVKVIKQENGVDVPYQVHSIGLYVVVEAGNGLILMWDKKNSLFIKLSSTFQGQVCGLCGNYDGNGKNDFTSRNQEVVVEALEFGNSWKVSPSCPNADVIKNPCTVRSYRQSWSLKRCSIITSNVFSACHSQVDPTPFHDACVRDSCACDTGGDCECFCTAVAAYAQACNEAGACIKWRTPDICPLFCDFYNPIGECEWHYNPCGYPCMKTCKNPSGTCSSQIPALEGCYPKCPSAQPYLEESTMKCVSKKNCGCYDGDGTHYNEREVIPSKENCQTCRCSSTEVSCSYDVQAYILTKKTTTPTSTTTTSTTKPTTSPTTTPTTTPTSTTTTSTTKPTTYPTPKPTTTSTTSTTTTKPTNTPTTTPTTTPKTTPTTTSTTSTTTTPTSKPITIQTTTTATSTTKPTTTPTTKPTTTSTSTTTTSTTKPTTTPTSKHTTTPTTTTTISTTKPTTTPTSTTTTSTAKPTTSLTTPTNTQTTSTTTTPTSKPITIQTTTTATSTTKPTTTPTAPTTTPTSKPTTTSTTSTTTTKPTNTPSTTSATLTTIPTTTPTSKPTTNPTTTTTKPTTNPTTTANTSTTKPATTPTTATTTTPTSKPATTPTSTTTTTTTKPTTSPTTTPTTTPTTATTTPTSKPTTTLTTKPTTTTATSTTSLTSNPTTKPTTTPTSTTTTSTTKPTTTPTSTTTTSTTKPTTT
ncbi:LOW QUALITY PROTEIN: mucin-2-like [Oncorhynchus tshawytscha]|uniref:LOW QUALITY PROTEIN: mucin-2-like n=1 Tax=Oncorhynchus tshawytscha TaxID=74940 RepID=UPI001C3C361D|nr:LOW QUALITY PROTEIN: mucin-2-like [Oncorhynchus tshawytscha]